MPQGELLPAGQSPGDTADSVTAEAAHLQCPATANIETPKEID
jgi:hypothetical protein